MHTVFHTHIGEIGELFQLEGREAEHLFRVFRARNGERVLVMDGRGGLGEAEVIGKNQLRFCGILPAAEQDVELDLYFAIPKKNKLDILLPQLPGLGVRSLHPLLVEHSVATGENPERWNMLLREGCKQSGNPRIPELFEPVSLNEALRKAADDGVDIFYGSVTPASAEAAASRCRAWFVGPEGGFTAGEEEDIRKAGGKGLKLGSWIMRIESAAVAGLAVLGRSVFLLLAALFLTAGCGKSDEAVSRHPLMIRADRCRAEGDVNLALHFYERLLRIRPDSPELRLKTATLCDEALNDPVAALYHYNIYLQKWPDSPDASTVEGYRLMARAKLFRELNREALPKPPADSYDEQQKLVKSLREENLRLRRALANAAQRRAEIKSEPPAPAAAVQVKSERLYTVRSGDTLSGIAYKHGISLSRLRFANGFSGDEILQPGQVIKIPH